MRFTLFMFECNGTSEVKHLTDLANRLKFSFSFRCFLANRFVARHFCVFHVETRGKHRNAATAKTGRKYFVVASLRAALLINLLRRGNGGAIEDKCHVLKLEFSESLIKDFCFRHRIKEFSPCAILIQTRWQLERTSLKAFKLMEKLCNFN